MNIKLFILPCIIACEILLSDFSVNSQDLRSDLLKNNGRLSVQIKHYDADSYNYLIGRKTVEMTESTENLDFEGSQWQISSQVTPLEKIGKYKVALFFTCLSGEIKNASVSAVFNFSDWSVGNYVLMPAAVYNGNRYPAVISDYMPFFQEYNQLGPNNPILLSDQPRLNYRDGSSRIQERSGSMSVPCVGFRSDKKGTGFFLCFSQASDYGDYGIDIEENKTRDKAAIALTSPVVREVRRHWLARMDAIPSTDPAADFKAGDKTTIVFIVDFFQCPKIQSLFDELADIRTKNYPVEEKPELIPFSAVYQIQEKKFNAENWRDAGYYAGGVTNDFYQDWQIGWTGGMITTLPLLAEGNQQTRDRVLSNFDWLYTKGVSPSGYYYGTLYKEKPQGDFPNKPLGKDLHLVRKNADATYYIFKQFDLMQKMNIPVKAEWRKGNLRAVDAQVKTWERYGQLGQFVNEQNGDLIIGNTTSAGIFPASLCAAFKQTGNIKYLETAAKIGDFYYDNFISKGLSCGGPGDAMQSFDSESSYGLLEGIVELYETTLDRKWLLRAEEMGRQFATWIVAFDYKFPPNTPHGKLDIRSTGGVYANTQNKTAPGGICTHSGLALLKLYRASGDPFFLNLLCDIAHAIPQFMSWKEHPQPDFHDGWISERCDLNDWLEGIGGTCAYSCWAETSMLLTSVELPGVYVNLDTKEVFSLDHIKASIIKSKSGKISLSLTNTTIYNAKVKLLAESKNQMQKPLGLNAFLNWPKLDIQAGKTVVVKLIL
jgi:hypothetical protein